MMSQSVQKTKFIGLFAFLGTFIGLMWTIWKIILLIIGIFLVSFFLIQIADGKDWGQALYLAFISFLNIGYGGLVPATSAGKVVCIVLGFNGYAFLGIIVSATTIAFQKCS